MWLTYALILFRTFFAQPAASLASWVVAFVLGYKLRTLAFKVLLVGVFRRPNNSGQAYFLTFGFLIMGIDKGHLRNWAGRIFSHFSCLPAPLTARIRVKQGSLKSKTTYSVCSKWKQADSCRNDCLIMDQEYSIFFRDRFEAPQLLYSSSGIVTSFSSCCSHAGKSETLLWDIEQDHLRAIFVEYAISSSMTGDSEAMKASAAISGTFVHLFCSKSGRKLKTIQLPTEKSKSSAIHGKVHGLGDPSGPFASCRFCPTNPYKIVYLAECSRNIDGKDPYESVCFGTLIGFT